jgi:RNA polymerase sigma-70 factor (ECF subfamily)
MSDDEFQERLQAAKDGDEAAFTDLFRGVQPALLRYLRTMAHNLGHGTADDVASDTWLQVVRGLGRFRGDESGFRAWVSPPAGARLVAPRRRANRLPVPHDTQAMLEGVAGDADVAESVGLIFSTESALATLRALPPLQAEVVLLRYVAGLDVDHTARLLGKRSGAVRVTAHRALRKLEALLDGRQREEEVTQRSADTVRHSR